MTEAEQQRLFRELVVPSIRYLYFLAETQYGDLDAEELVQTTLLKAYRGLPGLRISQPRFWLRPILHNTAISERRKQRTQLPRVDEYELASESVPSTDIHFEPEMNLVDPDFLAQIKALPERTLAVLVLVGLEHFTYREAGQILGLTEKSVKTWIYLLRKNSANRDPRARGGAVIVSEDMSAGRSFRRGQRY